MPKVRQRDPNDKIKTKGKKQPRNRKKKSNASWQIQAAVEQKVKQRKGNEASNEYATTTTEQAVVDCKRQEKSRPVLEKNQTICA